MSKSDYRGLFADLELFLDGKPVPDWRALPGPMPADDALDLERWRAFVRMLNRR